MKRKGLVRRLRNLGVDVSVASVIGDRWQRQIDSRGLEGAVEYLKRVGDTLVWFLTGSGGKPDWVRVTATGFPAFFEGCEGLPLETLVRISKIARTIVLDAPSDRQIGKVLPAVVTPFTGDPKLVKLLSMKLNGLARGLFSGDLRFFYEPKFPLILQQWRRVQSESGKTPTIQHPPLEESLGILHDARVRTLVDAIPKWESCFYPIHPKSIQNLIRKAPGMKVGCVGEIHATQEGGAKLRMFAAPFTVYQTLLTPLHDYVASVRRQLKTDCTYNQDMGAEFAQFSMREGSVVYSVDLSTATCRFPLEPQIAVLRGLHVPEAYINLLLHVCRGKWEVQKDLEPYFETDRINWAVGQPLGIKPSMSMFSLTHNLLLNWICHRCGVDPNDTFRILGDDVVITNDNVHDQYREIITQMGIPISEHKSHASRSYAEFAGYSIFQEQMIRPGQWRDLEFNNFKGIASQLTHPTVHEGSPILLTAVKLIRFIDGVYEPDFSLLNKYEMAATILSDKGVVLDNMFKSEAPLWCVKVEDYVKSCYPKEELLFFSKRFPTANRLLRGLGTVPDWLRNYAYMKDEFQCDHGEPIVFIGYTLALAYLTSVEFGAQEACDFPVDEVVQKISENTNAELWQPPPKRRNSVKRELRLMVEALRSSGLAY